MTKEKLPDLLLRIGLAFAFLYVVYSSFAAPLDWIGYFPDLLRKLVPDNLLLNSFSVYEAILALWLLSGKKVFYSAILAALTLAGVLIFNLGQMEVVFRDVTIILAALALALLNRK